MGARITSFLLTNTSAALGELEGCFVTGGCGQLYSVHEVAGLKCTSEVRLVTGALFGDAHREQEWSVGNDRERSCSASCNLVLQEAGLYSQ